MIQASEDVAQVRRFTRFYTRKFGVLGANLYDSELSLTEARVLYDIATSPSTSAGELGRDLGLDAGYLSRILRGFVAKGWLSRTPSSKDGRVQLLGLTAKGRALFKAIDEASAHQVEQMLAVLEPQSRLELRAAMATIEQKLGASAAASPITLRPHQPGDMGWVVGAHGALYAREYGWDQTFEALVADIVAKFIRDYDPNFERCWIAEMDGQPVGSVFIVKASDDVAKLRLLIIDPKARGRGLGKQMVDECIRFSRSRGYKTLTLWTNDILDAARAIYVKAGFELVASEKHHSFGQDLVGETWELAL